jgi:hypothetical protein
MAYETHVRSEEGIFEVRVYGKVDLPGRLKIREDVWRASRENNIDRLLVDLRKADFDMTTAELYDFGATFGEVEMPADARIAAVVQTADFGNKFTIAVAKSKGVRIEVFTGLDKAAEWLKE